MAYFGMFVHNAFNTILAKNETEGYRMKKSKRLWSLLVGLVLMVTLLASATSAGASEVISEETATLRMYGPGLFTTVGADGTIDMVTGLELPGYNKLIDRWHELYPNVEVIIEAVPWDNWKAAIQTAALSGEYDILIHGNGNADFCEDLTPYLEADPDVKNALNFYPLRRNPDNMTEIRPYGLSYTANPTICLIDLEMLQNYGLEAPTKDWTWEEFENIAATTTGTDPVTGQQTYGLSMFQASGAQQNYIVLSRVNDNEIFEFSEKLADCKFNFNTEKTIATLEMWQRLGAYQSPDYAEQLDKGLVYTADNNIAMVWFGEPYTMYKAIKQNGLEDRFMLLTLPAIEEGPHMGLTSSNMADLNIAMYNKGSQKDLAWAFMKFLTTDPGAQQWIIETGFVPNNLESVKKMDMPPQYRGAVEFCIESNPADYNSSASVWYDSTWFGTLQSDIVAQSDLLLRGSITPAEMAQYIQDTVDTYLSSLK